MSLRLGVFSPSVVVGVDVRRGLSVVEVPAASSSQQVAALLDGSLDAVLTSPDNVLAYRAAGRDVRILAALDRGLGLSLFAGPGLGIGDLRGGILAVDAPTSGFALVGYELLARAGLQAGDYDVRQFGSTPHRAAALMDGDCAMTVLGYGSDLRAEAAGCTRISRASSLGPYVGAVLAATRSDGLGPLTTALVRTARALASGRLSAEAAAFATSTLGLGDAGPYLAVLTDPREGLIPDGRLDDVSLATLYRLRGVPTVPVDPGRIDDRFLV